MDEEDSLCSLQNYKKCLGREARGGIYLNNAQFFLDPNVTLTFCTVVDGGRGRQKGGGGGGANTSKNH